MDVAKAATGTPVTMSDILTLIWLCGTAAVALWLHCFQSVLCCKAEKTRHILDRQSYPLPVYVSPVVDTPCLFGLLRPSIYLTPEAADSEPVLLHSVEQELTHFRHLDHIWALLRGTCLALHWFDPLVWWAAVLSRNDAELACDEATIKRLGEGERAKYGRTLIEMTSQKWPAPPP